ncbi:hypothetical protein FXB39_18470 [Nocardioides sp. BGMRC 2183]|nr:hypothetical protein FXB39_18470 [Nocardioides sp. BGMRC 2183]
MWQPVEVTYEAFTQHLARAATFPTYLPWPLGPGWSVTDFAVVEDGTPRATMTCVSGATALDGPVDVIVVSEETGTGLGARIAGLPAGPDGLPGRPSGQDGALRGGFADGPPEVKVKLDAHAVGLWSVSTSRIDREWDRSVLAGEARGRWLWLVLRPASAILLLRDLWILRDVSVTGPQLVTLPFGGPAPPW